MQHALLADDFFRLAHHHVSGRPLLHFRAVSVGLAAALLAELLYAGKITVQDGGVYVISRTDPPADALAHDVLDQLAAESQLRGVGTWLAFLAEDSYELVGRRLHRAGYVYPEASRRLLGRSVTWVPADMNLAGWPTARLSLELRDGRRVGHGDACLAGLVWATGLDRHLLAGAPAGAYEYLRRLVAQAWQPLAELVHHTHAAIGKAVAAHRT